MMVISQISVLTKVEVASQNITGLLRAFLELGAPKFSFLWSSLSICDCVYGFLSIAKRGVGRVHGVLTILINRER